MTPEIVIVGCGGFGREVLSILGAINDVKTKWRVNGFVDDDPSPHDAAEVARLGAVLLGSVRKFAARPNPYNAIIAVGSAPARRAITEKLAGSPVTYPTLVHPCATVGLHVDLGPGVVVASGARLSTNIVVGPHVHVDQNSTVGHDTSLGAFCRLNPQACLSGSVKVGAGAMIGANATVLPGLTIGANARVGAGAVVTRDVVPGATVVGAPARPILNDR